MGMRLYEVEIKWTHGIGTRPVKEFVVAEPGLLRFIEWFTESGWVMTKLKAKEWIHPDNSGEHE